MFPQTNISPQKIKHVFIVGVIIITDECFERNRYGDEMFLTFYNKLFVTLKSSVQKGHTASYIMSDNWSIR